MGSSEAPSPDAPYLVLWIAGKGYICRRLKVDRRVSLAAWRLYTLNRSSDAYDVDRNEFGLRCTCPHWTYRGANSEDGCKHCEALKHVGLL